MGIKIQKIRDSAKGEQCTLRTAYCNHNPETTVLAHAPSRVKGMGNKSHDFWAAYSCSDCHEAMDQHLHLPNIEFHIWTRAVHDTLERLYEKGIMCFPEKERKPRTVSKVVPRRMLWAVGNGDTE